VLEPRRQYADDAELSSREADRAVQNPLVRLEPAAPHGVAEHDDGVRFAVLFRAFEFPAPREGMAEYLEETSGHLHAAKLLGAIPFGELEIVPHVRGDPGKRLELGPVVAKVRRGHGPGADLWRFFIQPDELLGFRVGERRNEYAVDGAEDRGVGAHAHSQCQNSREGERGRAPQQARGVKRILEDVSHGTISCLHAWLPNHPAAAPSWVGADCE
jgi:hypothetical protein